MITAAKHMQKRPKLLKTSLHLLTTEVTQNLSYFLQNIPVHRPTLPCNNGMIFYQSYYTFTCHSHHFSTFFNYRFSIISIIHC